MKGCVKIHSIFSNIFGPLILIYVAVSLYGLHVKHSSELYKLYRVGVKASPPEEKNNLISYIIIGSLL